MSGTDFSRRELIDKAKRLLNKPLKSDKLEPNELLQEFKHVLNCSGPQLTCPGSTVPLHEVASDTDFRWTSVVPLRSVPDALGWASPSMGHLYGPNFR